MAESAVLEREETTKTSTEKALFEEWKPLLEKAGTDYNLRDAIMRQIRENKKPVGGVDQVSLEDLRQMSEEEREKKYAEIRQRPILEKPEDLAKLDRMLDMYMDQVKGAEGILGDESVPPGERLKNKDDWSDYGWSDGDKKKVAQIIMGRFQKFELAPHQVEMMLEMFLAAGKKPADFINNNAELDKLEREAFGEFKDSAEIQRETKGNPEVHFLKKLGISYDYTKHFILNSREYFGFENDQEVYYQPPKNIEELAWQIMQTPGKGYKGWGIKGKTPLLDMWIVKDKNGNVDKEKSKYRVNTSNMTRWARYNMYTAYDLDREDPHDFFKSIALKSRYPISLQEMLLNPDQYFKSEDGSGYKQLMLQWYKEAAIFGTLRSWDVAYREVIGEPDELMKVFRQMFNTKNLLTRGALGSNLINLMSTLPLNFEGMKEGEWSSDNVMGAGIIDIYRAYDALSDYDTLRDIFGHGSKFFTRSGWEQAIQEVAKENIAATGVGKLRVLFGLEAQQYYADAFDENGEISSDKNRRAFIKLANIFGPKQPGGKHEFIVRAAMRHAVAEKYGSEVYVLDAKEKPKRDKNGNFIKKHAFIAEQEGRKNEDIANRVEDDETLKIAEAIAWSMARPFGAHAKNDTDGVDHDEMSKRYNTYKTRIKYPGKGDKLGNALTVSAFKRMTVDPMNALITEAPVWLFDEDGNALIDKKTGKQKFRYKTILEVFKELSEFQTKAHNRLSDLERRLALAKTDEAKEDLRREIDKHKKDMHQGYQDNAQKLSFKQRLLSNYYEDHLRHSNEIYKQTMANQEMEWEKYTSYDALGGVRFKGAEFQSDFQDKWLHKIRYMFENYNDLNFNMKVRMLDQEATANRSIRLGKRSEPVHHDVYLGEALFGHEMLNRPIFWKRDKKGKPIHKRDHRGRKMKGIYEIDYQKVQDNKKDVWKSWLLMKIAADFYSHRALHENEPRFNFTYYQQAIGAIARLPGDIEQNEFDFKATEGSGTFFSKEDIAWLKRKARVENFDLYWRAFFKDIFMDDKPEEGIGLLLALSLATKAILEYKT